MDLLDLLWDVHQDRRINDLNAEVDRLHEARVAARGNVGQLVEENAGLRLRLGLLVRLLISKGVITAEEFAGLIAEAQPKE
jgi:hypothetical protein